MRFKWAIAVALVLMASLLAGCGKKQPATPTVERPRMDAVSCLRGEWKRLGGEGEPEHLDITEAIWSAQESGYLLRGKIGPLTCSVRGTTRMRVGEETVEVKPQAYDYNFKIGSIAGQGAADTIAVTIYWECLGNYALRGQVNSDCTALEGTIYHWSGQDWFPETVWQFRKVAEKEKP